MLSVYLINCINKTIEKKFSPFQKLYIGFKCFKTSENRQVTRFTILIVCLFHSQTTGVIYSVIDFLIVTALGCQNVLHSRHGIEHTSAHPYTTQISDFTQSSTISLPLSGGIPTILCRTKLSNWINSYT